MKSYRLVLISFTASILLAFALPSTAASAGASSQLATAAAHAKMAAQSAGLDGVQMHLHHVVNCLVGPDGEAFDASAGNPCKGKGNGALNDMGDDMGDAMADQKAEAQSALDAAMAGLSADALEKAQSKAGKAHDILAQLSSQ